MKHLESAHQQAYVARCRLHPVAKRIFAIPNGGKRSKVTAAIMKAEGVLAGVPTAREQGFDVVWPIIRGLWMGPQVPDADYQRWVATFERAMATPQFAQWREQAGLSPFALTGAQRRVVEEIAAARLHEAAEEERRRTERA